MENTEKLNYLKKRVQEDVYKQLDPTDDLYQKGASFIFDFRRMFLDADFVRTCAELFWSSHEDKFPFQVGGIESAAIPLITAIVLEGKKRGKNVSAFYMRKSRKKSGLGRVIEGRLNDLPVVLVDDLINFGNSFLKIKETLDFEKQDVVSTFTIIRYRELAYYKEHFSDRIEVQSLFTIKEFRKAFQKEKVGAERLKTLWYFRSENADFFYHGTKSVPVVLSKECVLTGSDSGTLWFLNTKDGSVNNKLTLGLPWKKKHVQHTPLVLEESIIVTMVSGDVYCTDLTGKRIQWGFFDMDYCYCSPIVINDFIYLLGESKLPGKRGVLYMLDSKTGSLVAKKTFVSAPIRNFSVDSKKNLLVITKDGALHCLDSKNLRTRCTIETQSTINGSMYLDTKTHEVFVTSSTSNLFIFNLRNKQYKKLEVNIPSWSIPLVTKDSILISSLNKTFYSLNRESLDVRWEYETRGRMFASPVLYENHIYVGSNDGRLYVFNVHTGKHVLYFQTTERIIDKVVFDTEHRLLYVSTQGNEIYALSEPAYQKVETRP